jgi:hypothetical protein
VVAYTAQLGNGFSATISAESRRTTQIIGQDAVVGGATTFNGAFFVPGASAQAINGTINGGTAGVGFTQAPLGGIGYGGWHVPDIVANLRVDQAWGSAAVAGALHQVNTTYNILAVSPLTPEQSGHPSDEWGWAAMAGLRLNTPYIGTGDYLQLQAIYTQGALRYIFQNPNGNWWVQNGLNAAYGVLADGVFGGTLTPTAAAPFGTTTNIQLTTAWGLNAGYEHFWNPRWRTSLYGGYTSVSYNGQANAILCTLQGSSLTPLTGTLATAGPGCDNNWTSWWVGSRTQWNVTKDFYMGLDVAYMKVDGMSTTSGFVTGATITPPVTTNLKTVGNEDIWMARFRVHRDFYP